MALEFYKNDLQIDSYGSTLIGEFELWQMKWEIEIVIPTNFIKFSSRYSSKYIYNIENFFNPTSYNSFSWKKFFKRELRNSTSENRLNGLALLNVHRDIDIDIVSLIDVLPTEKKDVYTLNYK